MRDARGTCRPFDKGYSLTHARSCPSCHRSLSEAQARHGGRHGRETRGRGQAADGVEAGTPHVAESACPGRRGHQRHEADGAAIAPQRERPASLPGRAPDRWPVQKPAVGEPGSKVVVREGEDPVTLTLTVARGLVTDIRAKVRAKIDPAEERRTAKRQEQASALAFDAYVNGFVAEEMSRLRPARCSLSVPRRCAGGRPRCAGSGPAGTRPRARCRREERHRRRGQAPAVRVVRAVQRARPGQRDGSRAPARHPGRHPPVSGQVPRVPRKRHYEGTAYGASSLRRSSRGRRGRGFLLSTQGKARGRVVGGDAPPRAFRPSWPV
jgi:hypothetical protein